MIALCQTKNKTKNTHTQHTHQKTVNKSHGSSLEAATTAQPNLQLSLKEVRDRKKVECDTHPRQPQIRKPQEELHTDVGISSKRTVARDGR